MQQTIWSLAVATSVGLVSPAGAQSIGDTASDDIIVTALKREQNLSDVPASITALSADDLARSGITNSFDLQQLVPGLAISFGNRETNVAIRGVSNNVRSIGADPSNAVHLDGIYLPQSSMVLTDLFDVSRVEVLKGPQGTLYGRNATGGAINVISTAPTPGFSAQGMGGYGSYNLVRLQGAINAGNDTVAARIAGSYVKDDGYTRNVLTGGRLDAQDFLAFRGQVRFNVTDDLSLTLLAQVNRDDGTVGYGISTDPSFKKFPDNFYGLVVPANLQRVDERNIRLDSPVESRRDSEIYGATLEWRQGPIGIRSITGFTRYDSADSLDYDFTGDFNETFDSTTNVKSFSQEVQFFGTGTGPLQWTGGLYYYTDDGEQFIDWFAFGPFARANTTSESAALAAFGQATYAFNDQWSVMVGARYNDEIKRGTQENLLGGTFQSVRTTFDAFTPQGQIQFRPNDDTLIFAGVTKGFKSGGFNLLAAGTPTQYDPETIIAYEIGARTSLFDGALKLNGAFFHYDYRDLQLRTLVLGAGGAVATVSNAESATINGVELGMTAKLGEVISLDASGTWLDASFGNYVSPSNDLDLSGTRLPLSPRISGSAGINADFPVAGGGLRARAEVVHRSSIIFPLTLDAPERSDEASTLVNATLRWTEPGDRFYVEVVGRNIFNDLYRVQRADVFFSGVYDSFGAPRTIEGRIGFRF